MIALSRVYLGAHYPLDVAAGGLVGVAAGSLARLLVGRKGRTPMLPMLCALVLGAAVDLSPAKAAPQPKIEAPEPAHRSSPAVASPVTLPESAPPAAPAAAPEKPEPAKAGEAKEPRFGAGFVPMVNFNSDFGLGAGAAASLFHFNHGIEPYEWDLEAAAYLTTGGVRLYGLTADVPQIAGSPWRVNVLAAYTRDLGAPFYGIGNGGHATSGAAAAFNNYDLEDPTLRVYVRRTIAGPLVVYAGFRFSRDTVKAAPSSLVAESRPYGIAGGMYNQLNAGLLWDSRDSEVNPTNGILAELTGRTAAPWLGSKYQTYSAFVSFAGYRALRPGTVLAARVAFDRQWGDVPFTHMDDFGGLYAGSGLGGSQTIRGLLQSQLIGKQKLLANIELRQKLHEWTILERSLELDAGAFFDIGRVWAGDGSDGDAWNFHHGAGGGLRVVWDHVFLVRADVGYGEGSTRVYVDLGHAF